MSKRVIIPANPGFYRVVWDQDYKVEDDTGRLRKDPILAWEVECSTDEEFDSDRQGLYALPVCVEGVVEDAIRIGVLTPDGTVTVVCYNPIPDIDRFVETAKLFARWKRLGISAA